MIRPSSEGWGYRKPQRGQTGEGGGTKCKTNRGRVEGIYLEWGHYGLMPDVQVSPNSRHDCKLFACVSVCERATVYMDMWACVNVDSAQPSARVR